MHEIRNLLDNILYFVNFVGEKILLHFDGIVKDITGTSLILASFFKVILPNFHIREDLLNLGLNFRFMT